MKKVLTGLLAVVICVALLVWQRHLVLVQVLSLQGVPTLLEAEQEGPGVSWYDDYYTLEWLDARTVAIGEPRYYQQNINYLIIGDERAVLFDAGSGFRQIKPVAQSLTDKPITFIPSHFHYDHLGDGLPFERIAIVDLPHIRARVSGGQLTLDWREHLGAAEGYATPTFSVHKWLAPNGSINLGNRRLEVFYTPGHTNDSISLYDRATNFLFSGDFLYQGDLFAFLPNSNLADYRQGVSKLLASLDEKTVIYGAHRTRPPGTPVQGIREVRDLQITLQNMVDESAEGQGIYPVVYRVNESMNLLVEPAFLQEWQATYPGEPPPATSG